MNNHQSMTSYQINVANKSICQRTLAWLRDHSEVNASGIIQVENSIHGMGANQVIMGMVDFDPPVPDGTKLRLMRQALSNWRQDENAFASEDLVKTFKETLATEILSLERNQASFTILAFLNVEQEVIEPMFPIILREYKLCLPTWSGLDNLCVEQFWKELEMYFGTKHKMPLLQRIVDEKGVHYHKQKQNVIPVTIELKALDPNTALYTAANALDFFRAVINLPSALSLFRKYGSSSSSLSKFLPSPIYGVFLSDGEYEKLYYAPESHRYKRQRITAEELDYCKDLLSDLRNAVPGELKYLVVKAIKLYQQAFDFTEYQATYLGLWQLLEVLTLNEPTQGRTQVDKRIVCLLDLRGDDVLRDAIKLLMNSRNTLVHNGVFSDYADGLVFTLKGIVDLMLLRIMELSDDLSTESELREYYRLVSQNDVDLRREASDIEMIKGVIEFIQNSRVNN
jgi:hypothetical protein